MPCGTAKRNNRTVPTTIAITSDNLPNFSTLPLCLTSLIQSSGVGTGMRGIDRRLRLSSNRCVHPPTKPRTVIVGHAVSARKPSNTLIKNPSTAPIPTYKPTTGVTPPRTAETNVASNTIQPEIDSEIDWTAVAATIIPPIVAPPIPIMRRRGFIVPSAYPAIRLLRKYGKKPRPENSHSPSWTVSGMSWRCQN